MQKAIRKLDLVPKKKERLKVAAYCRVSTDTDRLLHSLSAQVSYYNNLIQNNPEWEFAGVYADEGISGTGIKKRKEFQRMIIAAEEGKIDIILTKSIQRFARNTVDLLNTIRHLKEIGVEVRFEKERINSLSGDGELMLSILASFAQEEVQSLSQNCRWGAARRMQSGKSHSHARPFGYAWKDDVLHVVEFEAAAIRRMFSEFLEGKGQQEIANEMNENGYRTTKGNLWNSAKVGFCLGNITYTGNMLLGKTFSETPMDRNTKPNRGQYPQYYVENSHEAIVSMETFEAVKKERELRRTGKSMRKSRAERTFLNGLLVDENGRKFSRNSKANSDGDYSWRINYQGNTPDAKVLDSRLREICCEVLELDCFDEETVQNALDSIVYKIGTLTFAFRDGSKVIIPYEYKTKGWTDERRAHWRESIKKAWADPEAKKERIRKRTETCRRKKKCQSQEK